MIRITSYNVCYTKLLRFQLNVVDNCTHRDVLEWKCITDFDVGTYARLDNVAHFKPLWSNNVAFFTVSIVDQSDVRSPVRVVLDSSNAA